MKEKRIYLCLSAQQKEEIKSFKTKVMFALCYFYPNWETDNFIDVPVENIQSVTELLLAENIPFTTNISEVPYGDLIIKSKIDLIYEKATEVFSAINDEGDYSDDENEVLDELANFINAYKNAFGKN